MWETLLYLGLSTPDGAVSDPAFDRFLAENVSPRWGSGYTILDAQGVLRRTGGPVQTANSRVLMRLHDGGSASSLEIESIRDSYKRSFKQDSVLRTDRVVCADF